MLTIAAPNCKFFAEVILTRLPEHIKVSIYILDFLIRPKAGVSNSL